MYISSTSEEVRGRSYSCAGVGRCPGARGSDYGSWTGENSGFSSQKTQREGDSDGEGSLRGGNPGDDLGDGGPHEEVVSLLVCW